MAAAARVAAGRHRQAGAMSRAAMAGATARRWRLLKGPSLRASARLRRSESDVKEVVGRCPGCGGLVRLPAGASPVCRCGHCETPLIACVDGLDVELAVQARLYSATPVENHSFVVVDTGGASAGDA
jgi:hypothetical protein